MSSSNSPYPGATPLGFERLQIAMAHLISMKQQLEADLNGNESWKRTLTSHETKDLSEDQNSETESIFDDNESMSSQSTHITTSSNNSASTAEELDHPEYTYKDLDKIFVWIAMRCDLDRLADIVEEAQILLTQDFIDNVVGLCLYPCKATGIMHGFEEDRRCIRCDAQLCETCQKCVFSLCQKALPHESYAREDTLAARRIWPRCSARCKRQRGTGLCDCSQHFMKPNHNCKSDGGHLCDACFRVVTSNLGKENTRSVQQESGNYIEYACACGAAANLAMSCLCKLCYRPCIPFALGDVSFCLVEYKIDLSINAGVCPWILLPLPKQTHWLRKRMSIEF